MTPPAPAWVLPATRTAAALSLVASLLHAALVDAHLDEWWGYGLFFIGASIGQGLLGLVLFAVPARPSWPAADWRRWRLGLYGVGIAGNLAVLVLYAITRTVGIPLFGPEAGDVEAVGPLDLPTKATEFLTVVLLGALHRQAKLDGAEAPSPRIAPDGT